MRLARVLLLLALPALAACPHDGAPDQPAAPAMSGQGGADPVHQAGLLAELDGSRWQLAGGLPGHDPAEVEVTLEFDAGRIGGNGGCNSYGADIHAADGRVHIGAAIATKRGCPGNRNQVEMAWLGALKQVRQLQREDGALLLLGDGLRLRLLPAAPRP